MQASQTVSSSSRSVELPSDRPGLLEFSPTLHFRVPFPLLCPPPGISSILFPTKLSHFPIASYGSTRDCWGSNTFADTVFVDDVQLIVQSVQPAFFSITGWAIGQSERGESGSDFWTFASIAFWYRTLTTLKAYLERKTLSSRAWSEISRNFKDLPVSKSRVTLQIARISRDLKIKSIQSLYN